MSVDSKFSSLFSCVIFFVSFGREGEPVGRAALPLADHAGRGNPVEARVNLDAVEGSWSTASGSPSLACPWVERAHPVLVRPPAAPYPDLLGLRHDVPDLPSDLIKGGAGTAKARYWAGRLQRSSNMKSSKTAGVTVVIPGRIWQPLAEIRSQLDALCPGAEGRPAPFDI